MLLVSIVVILSMKQGPPTSNVRVHAVGDKWISSDLSTDENGLFEIKVIPGNS